MKFLHISDLHFHSSHDDNIQIINMLDKIDKDFSEHILLVTGDTVDDGAMSQYQNALEALTKFKGRIFIVPGNHDKGPIGNLYDERSSKLFDEVLMHQLGQDGYFHGVNTPVVNLVKDIDVSVLIISLDSNLETYDPFDFACGEIGEKQISSLRATLASNDSLATYRFVLLHHHPFMHGNPFMELKDARSFMRTLYQKVDLLAFGHKHVPAHWKNQNGIAHIIASGKSCEGSIIREIVCSSSSITVKDLVV